MPGKLSLMAVICSTMLLAACSTNPEVEPKRKFISFKLDDKVMLSEQRHSAYYTPGDLTDSDPANDYSELLVAGYSYDQDVVNLRVISDEPQIRAGVYTNALGGTAMIMEMKGTQELMVADEAYGNIVVIIHQIQDSVAIGQFSGNLVSLNDGSIKTVKDGYFKVIYKKFP